MNVKRITKWSIVLFLLAALPVMTVALAQDEETLGQTLVVIERGESPMAIPWTNTETEPNNGVASADPWCANDMTICGGVNGGIISAANDVDYWKVFVPGVYDWDDESEEWVERDSFPMLFDLEAQSLGSSLDTSICLYSDDGYLLACNNDTDTKDSLLYYNFEVTDGDTARQYYLTVRANNGSGAGPNGKYQLLVSTPYLFSAAAAGLRNASVEGIPIQAGDILAYSRYANGYHKWVMLLDLSDLGVKGNITNLSSGWRNSDYLMVSFSGTANLPGISGTVNPWEVVIFDPSQVGPTTAGTFQRWWAGKEHDLTTTGEKPDAVDWPDWDGTTRLLVSTAGAAAVYGGPATTLRLPDEDIGLWKVSGSDEFYPRWSRFFDTSATGLGFSDIVAFTLTPYRYSWTGSMSGDTEEIWGNYFVVVQGTGTSQKEVRNIYYWRETYDTPNGEVHEGWGAGVYWRGPDNGWNYNIDAIQVQQTILGMQ